MNEMVTIATRLSGIDFSKMNEFSEYCEKLIWRDLPVAPKKEGNNNLYTCPSCETTYGAKHNFCPNCGKRWE